MIGSKRGLRDQRGLRVFLGLLLSLVALDSYGGSPVPYVENKNQWPSEFLFGAEFPQTKVFLKDASIYFVHYSQVSDDSKSPKRLRTKAPNESRVHNAGELAMATFELTFLNALQPAIVPYEKQETKYSYFYGNEPSGWASGASAYGEIVYRGMYKGIDLKMYSDGNQMKYDWIVSPCGDARKIAFSYKGAEGLELRDENLVVRNKLGEVIETKPYAYQIINDQRRVVRAAFDIDNDVVTFVFPEGYDPNYELVIDPFLIFSSYSGSTLDNWGNTATPDNKGNLYSGGMVLGAFGATGFPTTAGSFQTVHHGGTWDIGILKYDSIGANLLYVTYLGGNGVETPQSLVVNSNNQLLILGATGSSNFPGTTGGFKGGASVDPLNGVDYLAGTDLFIAMLSEDGTQLLKSTYLGGSKNDGINFVSGDMAFDTGPNVKVESILSRNYGDQLRGDIIAAPDGSVYIASNTRSADFPLVNTDPAAAFHGGTHDAVIAKLAPDLSLVWTRMIGGSDTDVAYSIKITASGNIIVAGGTNSLDLAGMDGEIPTAKGGGGDGWIIELTAAGDQVVHGTYVGTTSYDQVYFIDLATNGDVLAYGQTKGQYPITAGVYSNPNAGQFLHRFKPDLKSTVFSTTFGKGGRTPDISPTAFLVNACDNIYMAGWGGFVNDPNHFGVHTNYVGGNTQFLPVTSDAWQKNSFGNDFYFMVLTGDATELVYATFLGGTVSPTHVDGGTSRFDKRGIVYHAVCAGCGGFESDFPSYHVPASRSMNKSNNCNNAAFKFDLSSLRAKIQTNNVTLTAPNISKICLPDNLILQNFTIGGEVFEWDFGDGEELTVVNKDNLVHHYKKPGRYTIKLKAIDHSTCIGEDSTLAVVDVFQPDMHAGPDANICFGASTRLEASGGATYAWKTIGGFKSAESKPLVAPEESTTYYVTMTDINGCVQKDTVNVKVVPGIDLSFEFDRQYDCETRPAVSAKNLSKLKEGEEAMFVWGDGTTSNEDEAIHNYEHDGVYTISLRATKEFCVYQVSQDVTVMTLKIPNVITPGKEDGLNDSFKLVYGDPALPKTDLNISVKIMDRWGVSVYESKHYTDDWKGANIDGGIYYYEVELLDEVRCKGWIHLIK
jgi:hypothetical protein